MTKAKRPETYCKSISVSVPLWMIEYIKSTPEIRPSTIFQMAIIEEKNRIEEYKICKVCKKSMNKGR